MRIAVLAFALPLALGCSATTNFGSTSSSSGGGGAGNSGSTATATGGAGGASSGSGGDTGAGGFTFGTGGGGTGGGNTVEVAEVFGQSASTLYRLDPVTKAVTVVGNFQGCDTVIDIALDKDGNMYGTTFSGFYRIDKTTAVCTHIADGAYPNSLSFVPKGTLDQNVEALVGYDFSNSYIRIDTATGAITTIAQGVLGSYASSGDIVSVIGGGTYLTVKGPSCGDCIIEVDPKTGAMKQMIGPLGHFDVFGLAYWGGAAYGFDSSGQLFQVDLTNGTTTPIVVQNPPPSYYGAGSTTSAPLKPPT